MFPAGVLAMSVVSELLDERGLFEFSPGDGGDVLAKIGS